MSLSLAQKAVDIFLAGSDRHDPVILLFGGEPMLWWENMPNLIRYGNTQAKSCHKQIQWIISTNGSRIPDDAVIFFKEHQVNLMIDIDGTEIEHNHHRPFASGEGSYATVLTNYQNLKSAKVAPLMVRATVTPQNPDAFHLYKTLLDLDPDHVFIFPLYGIWKLQKNYARDIPGLLSLFWTGFFTAKIRKFMIFLFQTF